MHGDHVGGLVAGDKLVFPNAIVRADKRDADFWLSVENMEKAPKEIKGLSPGRRRSVLVLPTLDGREDRQWCGTKECASSPVSVGCQSGHIGRDPSSCARQTGRRGSAREV